VQYSIVTSDFTRASFVLLRYSSAATLSRLSRIRPDYWMFEQALLLAHLPPKRQSRSYQRQTADAHPDWDRRRAHFDRGRFFVYDNGFWFGLDDGYFPWDYLPYYADDYYPYDYYIEPEDDSVPAYDNVPAADTTVQAAQTRLSQLGYYNGFVRCSWTWATKSFLPAAMAAGLP
jgi:hypothetical protein